MKIGNIEYKDYAAKKPVGKAPGGGFITIDQVLSAPSLSLSSVHGLSDEDKLELAVQRTVMEPDFKLGVFGSGVLTKAEVIDEMRKGSTLGSKFLQAELEYCNQLVASMPKPPQPTWPEIPKPPTAVPPEWKELRKCLFLRLHNRALFCENTTDAVTTPFANYRIANVHPSFASRGFAVVCIKGTDDIRANFIQPAKNTLTVHISGIGHGSYTLYTGHGGDHILQVGAYETAEVKTKSLHFLSCQTAAQLGPDTVAKGAASYAGYTENFILQWDDSSTPIDEFVLFAKSDSTYDLMMASGAAAKDAYDATIRAFNAAISQVPNTVAATYLTWDRDHLKLHGNGAAKVAPYRMVKVCFPFAGLEEQDALAKAGELVEAE